MPDIDISIECDIVTNEFEGLVLKSGGSRTISISDKDTSSLIKRNSRRARSIEQVLLTVVYGVWFAGAVRTRYNGQGCDGASIQRRSDTIDHPTRRRYVFSIKTWKEHKLNNMLQGIGNGRLHAWKTCP